MLTTKFTSLEASLLQLQVNSICKQLFCAVPWTLAIQGGSPRPGAKGASSFFRLFRYPSLGVPDAALANKSFCEAGKITTLWSEKATARGYRTDVDKTGASCCGKATSCCHKQGHPVARPPTRSSTPRLRVLALASCCLRFSAGPVRFCIWLWNWLS